MPAILRENAATRRATSPGESEVAFQNWMVSASGSVMGMTDAGILPTMNEGGVRRY